MKDAQGGLAAGMFVLLCIVAVVPGVSSLRGLTWPYDVDGFRDVAIAQAIRDGAWMSDPLYKGEVAWYPPLIPATISLTALVRDLPMPSAHVATGLWLNSLIPVAFFGCARRLLGTWPALAATCAFLFLPGRAPAWASATYSPWLFPAVAAQVPFYVGVWAWVNTLDRAHVTRLVGAGVLLGLTFLAHSAPGIVLAGIMLLTACVGPASPGKSRPATAVILVAAPFAVALLVVSPFLLPIATRHDFQVLNRAPATWVYDAASPSALLAGAARPSALVNLIVLGIGAVWGHRHLHRAARIVLASWAVIGASCLAYSLLAEQSARLPTIVSAYHFLFALRALKWLVFGCGFVAISNALARFLSRRVSVHMTPTAACASLVLLLAAAIYPRYLGREAFVAAPEASERAVSVDERHAYNWIRSGTDRSAVFLSSDQDAVQVVGPAGRFVVSVQPYFSNPYVDYDVRASAREGMFAALMAGDRPSFERLRQPFEVSHVFARDDAARVIGQRCASFLKPVFTSGSITIFEIASEGRS